MKVFGKKSLSSVFYHLCRAGFFCAAGYLFLVGLCLGLGLVSYWTGWENGLASLSMQDGFSLSIPPLNLEASGGTDLPAIIPVLLLATAAFYALSMWFLVRLFQNLSSGKIFQHKVVSSLRGLAFSFLAAAGLSFCIMCFSPHSDSDFRAGCLLLLFSAILFFIKEVFRQGVHLQEENELTI